MDMREHTPSGAVWDEGYVLAYEGGDILPLGLFLSYLSGTTTIRNTLPKRGQSRRYSNPQ